LVAILTVDRDTSLLELRAETGERLPGEVVQALVGEVFNRRDSLAQQVMQALAVYGLPVPPVGVDYLLQPSLSRSTAPGAQPAGQHAGRPP
jgi:hypothetical protein